MELSGFSALGCRRQAYLGGQAQAAHQADVLPGEVDLTTKAVAGRVGEGVVVVVPAFAEGERRHPRVVLGVIAALVDALTPAVGGRIDQPGAVIHDDQAQGDAP